MAFNRRFLASFSGLVALTFALGCEEVSRRPGVGDEAQGKKDASLPADLGFEEGADVTEGSDAGQVPTGDAGQVPTGDAGQVPTTPDAEVAAIDAEVLPRADGGAPAGTVNVGAACSDATACNPGAGGFCLTGTQFTGGYCTAECGQASCPGGSSCWNIGRPQPVCLKTCATPAECRQGYTCDSDSTCWPGTTGGSGTSPIGGPCTGNADCATPGGRCIVDASWPGGYCTLAGCSAQSPCPAGSDCYQLQGGGTSCFASCTTPSACRGPSYTCEQEACLPSCTVTGCDNGEVCDGTTGLCRTAPCTPGSCSNGLVCDVASGRCVVDIGTPPAGSPPSCPNLPDWRCTGSASYCAELALFEPVEGPGYDNYPINGETAGNQYRSYLRRDVIALVKHAAAAVQCLSAGWTVGNGHPAGLGDMSEANGAIPGTSIGSPGHPEGTHVNGRDLDIGYYQLRGTDNHLRPICAYTSSGQDQYHCVAPPDNLDVWRTALFIAVLHGSSALRVIGVDGQVGPLVESAVAQLCGRGWVQTSACSSLRLAFEPTDTGRGWYLFHHHHLHVSVSSPAFRLEDPREACLSLGCGARSHDVEPLPFLERTIELKRP